LRFLKIAFLHTAIVALHAGVIVVVGTAVASAAVGITVVASGAAWWMHCRVEAQERGGPIRALPHAIVGLGLGLTGVGFGVAMLYCPGCRDAFGA